MIRKVRPHGSTSSDTGLTVEHSSCSSSDNLLSIHSTNVIPQVCFPPKINWSPMSDPSVSPIENKI